jgi:hypothetical protein
LVKNADACFAIAVALAVIVALAIGHPSDEVVNAAILGVVGAIALSLLRGRGNRDLNALTQLAGDAISDRPYEIIWQKNHWDLIDRDHAFVKSTELLRFTRNDVATIADWSRGPGRIESARAKWRRSHDNQWIEAREIHAFHVRRGGDKTIYCFEEEHNRGDMLEWSVEHNFLGRFPNRNESVGFEARTRSEHPRIMRITWPADAPPMNVELRYEREAARELQPREKDGRAYVEEKVPGLGIGQSVEISWNW